MVGNPVVRTVRKLSSLFRAVQPVTAQLRLSVVEALEGRQLLSADPLAFQDTIQPLPYALNFASAQNGVFDKNGLGTGFTRVQLNKSGNQYQPALMNLNTAAGELDLTTTGTSTAGSAYGTDNSQVDALETEFNGTTAGFTVTTRLKGPLSAINAAYFTGGVYFGPDQDNYIKLVAEYDAVKGQTLQFTDEQNANTHAVNSYVSIGSYANVTTLDLRLTGNAGTGAVTASYSLNGAAFIAVPGTVTLSGTEKSAFFNSAARAGILVSSKNNLPPITLGFTHFEIDPGTTIAGQPSVAFTTPAMNATNVALSQPIEADLNLPNAAIDPTTITAANVYLYRTSDKSPVPAIVNTSGGGDSIILTPSAALAPSTQYTFIVTSGVTDKTGAAMTPFTLNFTTAAVAATVDPSIQFSKTSLPSATGAAFTDVQIGPDHRLYASTEDGRIFRWTINADGTLGTPFVSSALQVANGGNRLITGFTFDPSSTAANPILWVSNSYYALSGATTGVDFTGKITVISGSDLSVVKDAVVELPRSVADHSTEQPQFGPDGALYFAQASNTAYGAPDSTWGFRPEHLLNAAILRLDVTKITPGNPIDVKTIDAGGSYNPFAAGAPLTIYATGVRNAFDILWTQDGTLFAPSNGSSAGGNAPAYSPTAAGQVNGNRIDTGAPYAGPSVPALNDIQQTEDDYLYKIVQGGYYGHPDPARGEYVLDGGNPTSGVDPAQFTAYPVGTLPDANYRGYNFDFGPHVSADGIIEYQDKTFGGKLQGALFVTEYSAGSDIVMLTRDASGNVVSETRGIAGFTSLNNPVSLVEDPATGNIYVSELGAMRLTLLKPVAAKAVATASTTLAVFTDVAAQFTGGTGASATQSIVITNTGSTPLTLGSGAFQILNDSASTTLDAAQFQITNSSLPASLAAGQSFTLTVNYTANRTGTQYAKLQITSNDPSGPITVLLRGLGTNGLGGASEPSLPAILRAYNIPTITGDGVNDASINQTFYPAHPDASSQEVPMQRLVKASTGPVSIQLLASFNAAGAANAPLARVGYYTPGSTSALDKTELFTLGQSDAQTTSPTALGATTFDPGAASFGLYTIFPHFTDSGHPRISYSEDALNTWDASVPRKLRFFPLENPDGSVVPNAYVFAFEDNNIPFGSIQPYDSNDIVGIIRNVMPAADAVNAPVIGVENLDGVPASNRMVFNRIQVTNTTLTEAMHDTGTLLIRNTGSTPLTITALTLSDTTNWTLVSPPAPGTTVAANGGTLKLTVKFIATKAPSHTNNETNDTAVTESGYNTLTAGGVWTGTLTIVTNDPSTPSKVITLAGYWQHETEHEEEPNLQTLTNLMFGYGTTIAATQIPDLTESATAPTYYGEEVVSTYWNAVDTSQPVSVQQVSAFHGELNPDGTPTEPFIKWYNKGGTHNLLFTDQIGDGQTLFPAVQTTSGVATATFTPSGSFSMVLDFNAIDDTLNTVGGGGGHHVRLYPVRDAQGRLVPNTYLMTMDYGSATFENYDFQDLTYLVTNIRPASAAPAPTDAQAFTTAAGVSMQWAKVTDSTLVGYNVYRGTSPTGPFTKLTTTPITAANYTDAFAPAGVASYYRITAVDSTSESVGAGAFAQVAPAAPTALAASVLSASQIKLTWTAPAGAASYRIERAPLGSTSFVEIASGVTTNNYTDSGLQGSTTYVYQIRAQNAAGLSPYSTVAVGTTKAGTVVAPGTPGSLQSSLNSANQIVLSWAASSGTVTDYRIERQGPADAGFIEIASGVTGLSYIDTNASPTVAYSYRIRAENAGVFSAYSNTTQAASGLYAPTTLVATVISQNEVDLSWSVPAEPFTSYHIERAIGTGTFAEIATAPSPAYHDTTVSAGLSYTYRVRVENSGAFSLFSPTASALVSSGLPAAPALISGSANSATQVTVTWSAVSGADSYWLERKGPADANFVVVSQSLTGISYVDANAIANSAYTYRVRAHNGSGYSVFTTSAAITTPQASSFTSVDIGMTPAGSTNVITDGKDYDITAAGAGIYSTGDSFRFVYEPLSGDFDVRVQVAGLTTVSGGNSQAAMVARNTLANGSPMIALTASGTGGYRSKIRSTANSNVVQVQTGAANFPAVYLRMTRVGNLFTTYYSADAITWTAYGSATIAMNATINVGMGAMSTVTTASATAQFRGFSTGASPAAPAAPTGVNATAVGTSGINVAWSAVPGAASYTVLRNDPGSTSFTSIATGVTATTFADGSLSASSTYSYEIIAVNSAGSSPASSTASATTAANATAPGAPSALHQLTSTINSISMAWAASTGNVTEYRVERENADSTWTQVSPASLTATTFTDSGLASGTVYHYRVYAVNAVGPSGDSSTLDVSTLTLATAPSAPGTPTALALATSRVSITWGAATGTVTAYHLERAGANGIFTEIAGNLTGTSFTDTNAAPGAAYTYRVRAENTGLLGNYSATAAVTTPTFDSTDIGPALAGSTSVVTEGSAYNVTGGGPGVYANADGFRFLSQQHTGDFDIRVQVASMSGGGTIPQAGLMARATLDAGSPEVSVTASSTASTAGIFRFKSRTSANAITNQTQTGQSTLPNAWVRLTRVGNVFTSYYSTDGVTWTKIGSVTVALPSTVYIGLAAASNDTTQLANVQFRNFSEM